MKAAAIIIDNIHSIEPIIARHKKFLPKSWGMIHLAPAHIQSIADYNRLLMSVEFWHALLEWDRVLIFQHDSGLLRTGIEEFLQYDYSGAPWKWQEFGGNGGLSLRNPKTMIEVIVHSNWDGSLNEDHHICNVMHGNGMNLAPREVCEKFSVEACFKLGSLGYHDIDTWLSVGECEQIRNQYA